MLVAGNVIIGRREEEEDGALKVGGARDGNGNGIEEAEDGMGTYSVENEGLLAGAEAAVELNSGLVDDSARLERKTNDDEEDILHFELGDEESVQRAA